MTQVISPRQEAVQPPQLGLRKRWEQNANSMENDSLHTEVQDFVRMSPRLSTLYICRTAAARLIKAKFIWGKAELLH